MGRFNDANSYLAQKIPENIIIRLNAPKLLKFVKCYEFRIRNYLGKFLAKCQKTESQPSVHEILNYVSQLVGVNQGQENSSLWMKKGAIKSQTSK